MTKTKDISRLRALTDLVLDARLNNLQAIAKRRQETQQKLDGLSAAAPVMGEGLGIAEALTALDYQAWAELRRSELRQILASQTAIWLDARDDARIAFGKSRGFEKISTKLQSDPRNKRS